MKSSKETKTYNRLLFLSFFQTPLSCTPEFIDAFPWKTANWPYLFEKASQHRVLTGLYWFLRHENCLSLLPELFRTKITDVYYSSLGRAVLQQEAYEELSALFVKEGIASVPLAGIRYAPQIYETLALRPMGDIDILVLPSQFQEATKVLLEKGFASGTYLSSRDHLRSFYNQEINLELHHQLFPKALLSVFPDFKISNSLEAIEPFLGKPFIAIQYWSKKKRHAFRLCDYIRLPRIELSNGSCELKMILDKTDSLIGKAKKGDCAYLFCNEKRSDLFWCCFLARTFLRLLINNPSQSIHLSVEWIRWMNHKIKGDHLPA